MQELLRTSRYASEIQIAKNIEGALRYYDAYFFQCYNPTIILGKCPTRLYDVRKMLG